MSIHIIATAISRNVGGGFIIFEHALEGILKYNSEDDIIVYAPELPFASEKFQFVKINHNQKWLERLKWEYFEFKNFVKEGDLVISFQNTLPRLFSVKNIKTNVYLHQSLPFSSHLRFNLLTASGYKEFIKKHFYKFFILSNLKSDTRIIVQTEWMRRAFLDQIKMDPNLVLRITPNYEIDKNKLKFLNSNKKQNDTVVLFYPASYHGHKNHINLINAFKLYVLVEPKAKLVLTISPDEKDILKLIDKLELKENIELIGFINIDKIFENYAQCSALIFPSLLETLGLPLIEAALTRCPILASDLPYARELLINYGPKVFFDPLDINSIALAMKSMNQLTNLPASDFKLDGKSWEEFWALVCS